MSSSSCGDLEISEFNEASVRVVSCPRFEEPVSADGSVRLEAVVENNNNVDAEITVLWVLPNITPPDGSPINPVIGQAVNVTVPAQDTKRFTTVSPVGPELPDYVEIPGSYEVEARAEFVNPASSATLVGTAGTTGLLPKQTVPVLQSIGVGAVGAAGWATHEFLSE